MNLKFADGYWWPDINLESGFRRYVKRAPDMDEAIKYCTKKRTVIQAGGHCGVWPKRLAGIFERVYTFEPNQWNFRALMANITEENIFAARGILGDKRDMVNLHINPKNTGGHWVTGNGPIPQYRIDDYGLSDVDAIILDVEGFELFALRGAEETIRRCLPIIQHEDNGNFELKGGYPAQKLYDFFASVGYRQIDQIKDDKIWGPN